MHTLLYDDVILLPTFEERLALLRTDGLPSELTFDKLRVLNQRFYSSRAWRSVRQAVIARDLGYDLAVPGKEIAGRVIVHHINPLRPKDLYLQSELSLDPDNLITVSHETHQAIHFGANVSEEILPERFAGDTKLW